VLCFDLDGAQVEVEDRDGSLLDVLREQLGVRSVKDGCSPQGQCGCCTVLVDGAPRVSCVTPARRINGRAVTTLDGLDAAQRDAWGEALCATGGSQCGFCTPGIVMRLEALRAKGGGDRGAVEQALLAHLCRCTGWRTILDAWDLATAPPIEPATDVQQIRRRSVASSRSLEAAGRRAALEGGVAQRVGPDVALGHGGFADDTAPADSLVAVPDSAGGWAVGETLAEARSAAGKVQGRRTTADAVPPLAVPPGDWDVTLRTSWVEPAYLELDASWCAPGGVPVSPLANGGAFGAKVASPVERAARELADAHGRPVRVALAREDAVRLGPKRPPIAAGVRADGTGVVRVVRTPGIAAVIARHAPGLTIEEVDAAGPPTATSLRAAGWAEAAVLLAGAAHGPDQGNATVTIEAPNGSRATAAVSDGRVVVAVSCGSPLDEVVLRSYCVGAAHMGLSWVTSEALAVDDGVVHDLTIRSFGVLRACDTPPIDVSIDRGDGDPVNGSDAVFVAVAAATWIAQGCPAVWPTRQRIRSAP
jgi:aerobic-type carbon monoxide dehydrogenase small subunit (CoxS/CutS family)